MLKFTRLLFLLFIYLVIENVNYTQAKEEFALFILCLVHLASVLVCGLKNFLSHLLSFPNGHPLPQCHLGKSSFADTTFLIW